MFMKEGTTTCSMQTGAATSLFVWELLTGSSLTISQGNSENAEILGHYQHH